MNFYPIFLEDLIKFKRICLRSFFLASMVVGPCLYLLTFGWGLSDKILVKDMSYMEFLVPGIIALSSMNNSFNWTALSIEVGRTTFRTFEQYMVSPISPMEIMLGKVMSGCFRGVFAGIVIIGVAYLFGIRIHIGGLFIPSLLLNCTLFACLGVICGMRARVHGDTSTFSNFFLMPMSLFCGTFFPLDNLPKTVATLIYLLPLTHSATCIRDASMGKPVSLISFIYLGCLSLIFFMIGVTCIGRCRE